MTGAIVTAGHCRRDVCRYRPSEPMDEQTPAVLSAGDLSRRELTAEGQALTLGVELAVSGRLEGDVMPLFHTGGEIGYGIRPDVAGGRYATEACAAD